MKINTERLLLRPLTFDDADAIFKYHSDSEINQYQGWIPLNIDDVVDFIRNRISPEINITGTWFQFVIVTKESSELIGDLGIHFLEADKKQVELGITLNSDFFGKGYAQEALTGSINYLFNTLNKHRIITSIDPGNIKSIKLVEKLGFRKEAHFKESLKIRGVWVDDLIYAILKSEWNEKIARQT